MSDLIYWITGISVFVISVTIAFLYWRYHKWENAVRRHLIEYRYELTPGDEDLVIDLHSDGYSPAVAARMIAYQR